MAGWDVAGLGISKRNQRSERILKVRTIWAHPRSISAAAARA